MFMAGMAWHYCCTVPPTFSPLCATPDKKQQLGDFFSPSHSDNLLQALPMFQPGPEKSLTQLISVGKVTKKRHIHLPSFPAKQNDHTHISTVGQESATRAKGGREKEKSHSLSLLSTCPSHQPSAFRPPILPGVRGLGCRKHAAQKKTKRKKGGDGVVDRGGGAGKWM